MKTAFSLCLTVIGIFIVAPAPAPPEIPKLATYEKVNPAILPEAIEVAKSNLERLKCQVSQLQNNKSNIIL